MAHPLHNRRATSGAMAMAAVAAVLISVLGWNIADLGSTQRTGHHGHAGHERVPAGSDDGAPHDGSVRSAVDICPLDGDDAGGRDRLLLVARGTCHSVTSSTLDRRSTARTARRRTVGSRARPTPRRLRLRRTHSARGHTDNLRVRRSDASGHRTDGRCR